VFWRSSSEMSRPWRWLMRRILKRSVESCSGVASQGAGVHSAAKSEPSPQPTSSTWHMNRVVQPMAGGWKVRRELGQSQSETRSKAPREERFLTALTFSLLKTSITHICRCSKSGGKKLTDIVGAFGCQSDRYTDGSSRSEIFQVNDQRWL
jgi:hypothetical protein